MLDIRRRTSVLFLAVVVGHVILISSQVNTRSGVRVLEALTFGVFAEIQRVTSSGLGGIGGIWSGYVALRGVSAENDALRRRIADLEIELQKQRGVAHQAEALQQLLNLQKSLTVPTVAAQLIAGNTTLDFRTVTIDRGLDDGVAVDMAVIAPQGVVGRIVKAAARAAMVQLLLDRDAAAGALVERSRAGGVVVGASGDPPLQLEYMSNLADVKVGDTVVTSGLDGIYPKGFVVGKIESVERGIGLYKSIRVRPAVDFSRLEQVLVIRAAPAPAFPEASE